MGKGCNDYAEISLRRTSKCGGTMKVVAFIIEHAVVERPFFTLSSFRT